MMFARLKSWLYAAGIARKHCVDWYRLLVDALLDRDDVFRSRAGGSISCNAKTLLRSLVRREYVWRLYGDVFPTIKFMDDSIIIPNYFGKDFIVPLKALEFIYPPSLLLQNYPFDVAGEVVLDVGAYIGDTPLMWIYKGARSVIAVEPVKLHFKYLERNVSGLPVICLNFSVGVQLPYLPNFEGSSRYGPLEFMDEGSIDVKPLNVPQVDLKDLIEMYKPEVVKLNCMGCEHHVLDQILQAPKLGVKKIAVQLHQSRIYDPHTTLTIMEKELGKAVKTGEGVIKDLLGNEMKFISVYWIL